MSDFGPGGRYYPLSVNRNRRITKAQQYLGLKTAAWRRLPQAARIATMRKVSCSSYVHKPAEIVYQPKPAYVVSWQASETEALAKRVRSSNAPFRAELFRQYGARCAITGGSYNLDAAHIRPVRLFDDWDTDCNEADNGLVLRRDVHWAFDHGYWSIDPAYQDVHPGHGYVMVREGYRFPSVSWTSFPKLTAGQLDYLAGHYAWWKTRNP
jgi:hypothetical protein